MSDRWRFFFETLLANIGPALAGGLASAGRQVESIERKKGTAGAGIAHQVHQELSNGEMK